MKKTTAAKLLILSMLLMIALQFMPVYGSTRGEAVISPVQHVIQAGPGNHPSGRHAAAGGADTPVILFLNAQPTTAPTSDEAAASADLLSVGIRSMDDASYATQFLNSGRSAPPVRIVTVLRL